MHPMASRIFSMRNSSPVAIGFADSLSAPEVVWSLKDAGLEVVAIAKANTRPALIHSRFAQIKFITDPADNFADSVSDLQRIAGEIGAPLFMALDDEFLWLIQELIKTAPVQVAGATGKSAQVAL